MASVIRVSGRFSGDLSTLFDPDQMSPDQEAALNAEARSTKQLRGCSVPWTAAHVNFSGQGKCPGCGDIPHPAPCLVCHATAVYPVKRKQQKVRSQQQLERGY